MTNKNTNSRINQESATSLLSAEHGKHADALAAMSAKVEALKEELKTKDKLVSKLLDSEDDPIDAS